MRLVDLLTYARRGYYHSELRGSWSIKQVLPTVCSDLSYADLHEVVNGQAAQRAWREATPETRRDELRGEMCGTAAPRLLLGAPSGRLL